MLVRIDVYSHGIRISNIDRRITPILIPFIKTLKDEKKVYNPYLRKYVITNSKTYCIPNQERTEFWMCATLLDSLLTEFTNNFILLTEVQIVRHRPAKPTLVDFYMPPNFQPKPEQVRWVKYLSDESHINLMPSQTGFGKTFCSLASVTQLGVRTAVILGAKYVVTWMVELQNLYGEEFVKNEVIFIQGSKELLKYMKNDYDHWKIAIISNATITSYIKTYFTSKKRIRKKLIHPIEMCKLLRLGCIVHDEAHECTYMLYSISTFMNVEKQIYLSGTIESDSQFINKIYDILIPREYRIASDPHKVYIEAYSIQYGLSPNNLKHKFKRNTGYSHIDFENWILRSNKTLNRYLNFILDMVDKYFVKESPLGAKTLIYFTTVEMRDAFAGVLTKAYPDRTVGLLARDSVKAEVYKNDFILSTVVMGKASLDIHNLQSVFMTMAIGSSQTNRQAKGRLRQLKGEFKDLPHRFFYFTCVDIKEHVDYQDKKYLIFKDEVLLHLAVQTPFLL